MLHCTVWGSRGSIPVSGERFTRHGGSTTCIELVLEGATGETPERLIFDCGTGLVELGKQWGGRSKRALILQTHMHWDHIQGVPFFGPLFAPTTSVEFWSVDREGQSLRSVLSDQMAGPMFPVGLDVFPCSMRFKSLPTVGRAQLGELVLTWAEMVHPSGCTAWRVEYRGHTFVFSGDVEVQDGCGGALVEFARGADLLLMDAQYLPEEYPMRRGFGHSTPVDAVKVAQRAGVSNLVLTHHDPSHSDVVLDSKLEIARQAAQGSVYVDNARDGATYSTASMRAALQTAPQNSPSEPRMVRK